VFDLKVQPNLLAKNNAVFRHLSEYLRAGRKFQPHGRAGFLQFLCSQYLIVMLIAQLIWLLKLPYELTRRVDNGGVTERTFILVGTIATAG
jgi:hypothetical protein